MESPGEALHVEVVVSRECRLSEAEVVALAEREVRGAAVLVPGEWVSVASGASGTSGASGASGGALQALCLCDARHSEEARPGARPLRLYPHRLSEAAPASEAAGEESAAAMEVWSLPHSALHGLWESLVFCSTLKADILRFVCFGGELAARGLDERLAAAGRALLLHGAPGTGKTSLARALAHKLAVRLAARYPRAALIDLNAHSLFSKWFSESGKIVARVFDRINEIADDPKMLVVILIDEVESVASSRSCGSGVEPSDAVRAVNAVLSALDRARRRRNVVVVSTSNQPGALDPAYRDRADLCRLVPPPAPRAAYCLLAAAAQELARRGALRPGAAHALFPWRALQAAGFARSPAARPTLRLWALAHAASRHQVSGRTLRRLPFAALALHCAEGEPAAPPPLSEFLSALQAALAAHLRERSQLQQDHLQAPDAGPGPAPDPALLLPPLDDLDDEQLQALLVNGTS